MTNEQRQGCPRTSVRTKLVNHREEDVVAAVLRSELAQSADCAGKNVCAREKPLSDRRVRYVVTQRLNRHDAALLQVTEASHRPRGGNPCVENLTDSIVAGWDRTSDLRSGGARRRRRRFQGLILSRVRLWIRS